MLTYLQSDSYYIRTKYSSPSRVDLVHGLSIKINIICTSTINILIRSPLVKTTTGMKLCKYDYHEYPPFLIYHLVSDCIIVFRHEMYLMCVTSIHTY